MARRNTKPTGPTPEEKLTEALIELLESGVNPWQKDWSLCTSGVHRNLITGDPYRGSNPALLELWSACRGYSHPLWCGFSQAKTHQWFPRKGSKACTIIRPQLNKREREDEQGKPILGADGEPEIAAWTSFKPVNVFNAEDLTGVDDDDQAKLEDRIKSCLGSVVQRTEPERHALAEQVLSDWEVKASWSGNRAFYVPGADRIQLPGRDQFKSTGGLYGTWAHEVIHSTGHKSRLSRDGITGNHSFGSTEYAKEELIAELGAYLLGQQLQIGSATENHASYLKHWISVLKADNKILLKICGHAARASELVLACAPAFNEEKLSTSQLITQ